MILLTDKLASTVDPVAPWQHAEAANLDQLTVDAWIRQQAWTREVTRLMQLTVRIALAKEPSEVSLLYWLWYVRCGEGVLRLVEASRGAQARRLTEDAGVICERLAARLSTGTLHCSSGVVSLSCIVHLVSSEETADAGSVVATTHSGRTFTARYAVVALPPALHHKIAFSPPLPQRKAQLCARFPMGSVLKTHMFYHKAFWRERGMSGTLVSHDGPVAYAYEDSGPRDDRACLVGLVLATQAVEWCEATADERSRAIGSQYARLLGIPELAEPVAYFEKPWNEEEHIGGGYCASMPPNVLSSCGRSLREPHWRVHFAGTETATRWAGCLDGAVEAGERAAREVLVRLAADGRLADDFSSFRLNEPPQSDIEMRPSAMRLRLYPWLPGVGSLLSVLLLLIGVAVAAVGAWRLTVG